MVAEQGVALPSAMAGLVERLVAADPNDRPTTPQEVAAELEQFTDAGAVQAALARDDAGRAAEPGAKGPRAGIVPHAVETDRSCAGRSVAMVALDVDAVVDYYTSSPPPPWRVLGEPVADGESTVVTLSNGGRRARVTIRPDATTAGEGISRIVITYGSS